MRAQLLAALAGCVAAQKLVANVTSGEIAVEIGEREYSNLEGGVGCVDWVATVDIPPTLTNGCPPRRGTSVALGARVDLTGSAGFRHA